MKKTFAWVLVLFVAISMFSCGSARNTAVAGKNKDVSVDFASFKTYSWTTDIDNIPSDKVFVGPNGVLIFNNVSGRKMIKDAVQYELDVKGYKFVPSNPDMLVSFQVLEQPTSLRTTQGYVAVSSGERVVTEDNVSFTDVEAGTLIINLIDANQHKQVWQGFSSGIMSADDVNEQTKVRAAVSTVFKKFEYNNR